jgi:multidrug efflux pump subunit AcrB
MQGAARALFVPLSLAVGFAMITSYLLSSTFVPVLSVWLLRGTEQQKAAASQKRAGLLAQTFSRLVEGVMAMRWAVVPGYFALAAVLFAGIYFLVGVEIFPKTDLGQFQLRLRAPPGTRIEETEEIVKEALKVCQDEIGPDKIAITLGYIGVIPSSYPINTIYLWSSGPEEAVMRVSLKRGSGKRIEQLKPILRDKIDAHLKQWLTERWRAKGAPEEQIARRLDGLRLSFEPADIINEVMSFGSPTPVEIAVSGTNLADTRAYAVTVHDKLAKVESLKDLQYGQSLEYPTVSVTVDREKAGMNDVSAEEVARSLLAATSSSRFVVPNYWADPKTGIGYQVQVEIPQAKMDSIEAVKTVPVKRRGDGDLLLRDVADVRPGTMPGEYDRYNMRRVVSMTANVEGEDLGRALARASVALGKAGPPPAGIQVDVRGQAKPLSDIFWGLPWSQSCSC